MGKKGFKDRASKPNKTGAVSTQLQKILFSFEYLQSDFCFSCMQKDSLKSLENTLRRLSSMTWLEISNSGKHQSGTEKIPQNQIKTSIPSHITKEVNFIAFRFHDKKPMIGYRDGETFFILWFDNDFTLYNH